jgi:hypothetical protein
MVYDRPFEISNRVNITAAIAPLGILAGTPGTIVGVFGRDSAWRIVVRVKDDENGSQDFELAPAAVTLAAD